MLAGAEPSTGSLDSLPSPRRAVEPVRGVDHQGVVDGAHRNEFFESRGRPHDRLRLLGAVLRSRFHHLDAGRQEGMAGVGERRGVRVHDADRRSVPPP